MAFNYPDTKVVDYQFELHGNIIKDDYQWLEDHTIEDVSSWIKAQNSFAKDYLHQLPDFQKFKSRIAQLRDFDRISTPLTAGDYLIYMYTDGKMQQPIIVREAADKSTVTIIDPNTLHPEGDYSYGLVSVSADGNYVVISRSYAGSDWETFLVFDVVKNQQLEDEIEWIKFSEACWSGDGFYYKRYPKPPEGQEYTFEHRDSAIYYHQLGQKQSDDKLIYSRPDQPKWTLSCDITSDQKYLIIYIYEKEDGYMTGIMDLSKKKSDVEWLQEGFEYKSLVVDHYDGFFYVLTNNQAPNYKVISTATSALQPENWQSIIEEKPLALTEVSMTSQTLFCHYLEDASSKLYSLDLKYQTIDEIILPYSGQASCPETNMRGGKLFYSFSSFAYPHTIFEYDSLTKESSIFHTSEPNDFKAEDYIVEDVFYHSKDNTKVHMFLVKNKKFTKDANNPTLLYGYGGFNISISPFFSPSYLSLMEAGVVIAIANIRGGGEYGELWHQGGMLENKQNVFDDFISASEYLIDQKISAKGKICIAGGSNGGLLVGAVLNQRPDLFGAGIAEVGVMDMLKFHKYTEGWGWTAEYGCADNPEDFKYLIKYSPYHNIEIKDYPAVLVNTADHDDRVVPMHSFKYAAKLQKCNTSDKPIILNVETDAGHGGGAVADKLIEAYAEKWAFLTNFCAGQ